MSADSKTNRKCIIYNRVSTQKDIRLTSTTRKLITYCKEILGIDDIEVVNEVGSVLGKRPKFDDMMERINNKEFTDLLVVDTNRLYRPEYDEQKYNEIINKIKSNGVEIHSLSSIKANEKETGTVKKVFDLKVRGYTNDEIYTIFRNKDIVYGLAIRIEALIELLQVEDDTNYLEVLKTREEAEIEEKVIKVLKNYLGEKSSDKLKRNFEFIVQEARRLYKDPVEKIEGRLMKSNGILGFDIVENL